jgi:ribosomal-protein-alanine N-acetyltransferase
MIVKPMPTLDAGRFLLRAFRETDLDLVREASTDEYIPLITTVPRQFTDAEGLHFIERQRDRSLHEEGYSFAIADRESDLAVGQIGLWLRELIWGRASIGYWVVQSQRGRGAAVSALAALRHWAFEAFPIYRLELHIESANLASIRVAGRVGFQREGRLRGWLDVGGSRRDVFLYACLKADAAGQK